MESTDISASSTDNDTQLQATQTHTLFRLQSGRTMAVVKKGTTCLLILAYCVYFSFAMVMNFQKAIPLLCITVFACFCIFYTFTKRKFGHLIANPWQCNTIRRFWTSKSKKISMIMYSGVALVMVAAMVLINLSTPKNLVSLAGIALLLFLSWSISYHKTKIDPRPVVWGLTLQFLLGLFVLRTNVGQQTFSFLGKQVEHFLSHVIAGVEFVFGDNYKDFEFVFKPEASFTIRPYLEKMTHSELHAIMTAGFASVTADVFGLFVVYGISSAHILTAVLMSAPAGLAVSKIIYPEVEVPETEKLSRMKQNENSRETANVIDAAARGATDAIFVVFAVVASLISFLSLLHFINAVINYLGELVDINDLSLDVILSYILIPIVFLMGVPWSDCRVIGEVVGLKTVINEFVGYQRLGSYISANQVSRKAETIATYALCGFSNPTTIGITLSGLGALIPSRRKDLAKLVMTSWIAGSIACFLTACFAGLMYLEEESDFFPSTTLDTTLRVSTTFANTFTNSYDNLRL
ncbi:sodium/nucleoside cotransporter 2-like isoform X3 [Crassostrea virginica]